MNRSWLILVILAGVFWSSAMVLLVLGLTNASLGILRWVAIPDALIALVCTILAARQWTLK